MQKFYEQQRGNAFLGLLLIMGLVVAGLWYFNSDFSFYRKAESKTLNTYPATYTIDITKDGFFPGRIIIKPGDTITFVNKDSRAHHPFSSQSDGFGFCPGLDSIRPLQTNETFSGTFESETVCTYFDKLDDSLEGRIIIEKP